MSLHRTFLCAVLMLGLNLQAQETPSNLENHPAVKVVKEYLKFMLSQDWEASSQIVERKSLEDLRNDYVKRVKETATLDDEKMVVEKFKVKQLEDIGKLSGAEFYIAYHHLLKERSPVDPEVLTRVRESMKLRVLSVAEETDSLVHVLVRTKHNNEKVVIESLEIISLIKVGDKWMVGLNEQTPKITPLAAKTDETPAPEKAVPESPKPEAPKPDKPKSGSKPKTK